MRFIQGILLYVDTGVSRKLCSPQVIRTFSTNPAFDNNNLNQSSFESADHSEQRPFGDTSRKSPTFGPFYQHSSWAQRDNTPSNMGYGNAKLNQSPFRSSNYSEQLPFDDSTNTGFDSKRFNQNSSEFGNYSEQRPFGDTTGKTPEHKAFYQKLDRAERSFQGSHFNSGNSSAFDGLDEGINTLCDGMESKLKQAAAYFEFDPDEVEKDDYSFRKDITFFPGSTYDIKDLDLRKPGVQKSWKRPSFQTTTREVLEKADFRNVGFLANFITDAGIIIKRSKTGISATAQRKVAREIKTARAFGLLPFTTMGTKHFKFGKTMENLDSDYAYETHYHNFVDTDASVDPLE
ncbi:unnamed protein product [Cuscuta epithymum]|uniref:Small ribosomal subunit protein bS18c n=1 Tax=Cuscuta epithymum TaxID=186058 RepID=A0AAV0F1X6_9ASTE|nr:unnamed protein product [Cuscuta epithymum]